MHHPSAFICNFPSTFLGACNYASSSCSSSRPKRRLRSHQPITCAYSAASAAAPEPEADAIFNTPPPPPPPSSQWQQVGSCDVLIPSEDPVATVLFIGGLGAGINPPTFYGNLLQRISKTERLVIVCARLSPIPSTDHLSLSQTAIQSLFLAVSSLSSSIQDLPVIGMGHSLGSKLLLLASLDSKIRAALPLKACIFLSFNNSRLRQALPIDSASGFVDSLVDGLNNFNLPGVVGDTAKKSIDSVLRTVQGTLSAQQEFTPSPEATLAMIGARYAVHHNLVVSFQDDDIDDGPDLIKILKARFGKSGIVMERSLVGTHLTPVAPDFSNSNFSSIGNQGLDDAVRRAGLGVTKEVDGTVAVIVAFIRLHLQMQKSD